MSNLSVKTLPLELKRRIASFLSAGDAILLSQTCKALHSSLVLSSLSPPRLVLPLLEEVGHWRTGDDILRSIRIPVLQRRVHSLTLSFDWRGQRRGESKGKVWIAGRSTSLPIDPEHPYQGGTVVCESPLAPHTLQHFKMTFVPTEGLVYHLFYRIGGSGGHQLRIENGMLTTVIFDDEERNIASNYQRLTQVGVIGPDVSDNHVGTFYPGLLMRVSKALRQQLAAGQAPDPAIASYFEDFDIPVNEDSLLAVQEIVQADIEERKLARLEEQETGEGDTEPAPVRNVMGGLFEGALIQPVNWAALAGVGDRQVVADAEHEADMMINRLRLERRNEQEVEWQRLINNLRAEHGDEADAAEMDIVD